jgi:hypothetical protein
LSGVKGQPNLRRVPVPVYIVCYKWNPGPDNIS